MARNSIVSLCCSFFALFTIVGCGFGERAAPTGVDSRPMNTGARLHVGTCADACGGESVAGDCWCDDWCLDYGDCCLDWLELCVAEDDSVEPTCTDVCGGPSASGTCWCDDLCATMDDCCDDWADQCGPPPSERVFEMEQIKLMPAHSEFLLVNKGKSNGDTYASFTGVRVFDVLTAAGVDLQAIEGITVTAPDGYSKDFDVAAITNPFPASMFHAGLDTETLGEACGFVTYPSQIPEGVTDGAAVPGVQWLLLAYERDGSPIEKGQLDPESGKIRGSGPFHLIVPQTAPGVPDRGSRASPTECNDGHDYDEASDHNAHGMVRSTVSVRINPATPGGTEFDVKTEGLEFMEEGKLIVYGM